MALEKVPRRGALTPSLGFDFAIFTNFCALCRRLKKKIISLIRLTFGSLITYVLFITCSSNIFNICWHEYVVNILIGEYILYRILICLLTTYDKSLLYRSATPEDTMMNIIRISCMKFGKKLFLTYNKLLVLTMQRHKHFKQISYDFFLYIF